MLQRRKTYLAKENSTVNVRKTLLEETDKEIVLLQQELEKVNANSSKDNESVNQLQRDNTGVPNHSALLDE